MNKLVVINTYSLSYEEQEKIENAAKAANDFFFYEYQDEKCKNCIDKKCEVTYKTEKQVVLRCAACFKRVCISIEDYNYNAAYEYAFGMHLFDKINCQRYRCNKLTDEDVSLLKNIFLNKEIEKTKIETKEDMEKLEKGIELIKEWRKIFGKI